MRARLAVLVLVPLLAGSCRAPADLARNCRIAPETTGWFDAGITEDGKNKLVPSIVFRVRNAGDTAFGSIQFNCLFKRIGDSEEWSAVLVRGASAGADHLAPGATSGAITVRSPQGYTGTEPRVTMLQNRLFVDFKAEIFGKSGSSTWVKLGEFRINRQLLANQ
jgi:hypothetical protein